MRNFGRNFVCEEAKGGDGGAGASGGAASGGAPAGGGAAAGGGRSLNVSGGGSPSAISKSGDGKPPEKAPGDDGAGSGDAGKGGAAGGDGKGWRDSLPEAIRGAKSLEKFKDQAALAQAYLSMESAMGGKKLVVPDPKTATKEDWNEFYKAIGRPDTADKYELKMPEEIKDLKADETFVKEFRSFAHEIGMPAEMAGKAFNWYMKSQFSRMGANKSKLETEHKAALEKLDKEWGAKWDENTNKANVTVDTFGDDEFKAFLKLTGPGGVPLSEDPRMARFLAKVGDGMTEDTFRENGNPAIGKGASDIEAELGSIRSDVKGAYYDSAHPGHQAAVEKVHTLTKELTALKNKDKEKKK